MSSPHSVIATERSLQLSPKNWCGHKKGPWDWDSAGSPSHTRWYSVCSNSSKLPWKRSSHFLAPVSTAAYKQILVTESRCTFLFRHWSAIVPHNLHSQMTPRKVMAFNFVQLPLDKGWEWRLLNSLALDLKPVVWPFDS